MGLRCLVFWLWLTGYFSLFCEGEKRSFLASPIAEEAAKGEGRCQESSGFHLGQEEKKVDQSCIEQASVPSQLGSLLGASAHTQKDSDDLVLPSMPSTEWPKIRNMPWMQSTLESGMVGSDQTEIQEQKCISQEEGGSKASGCRAMAGISRQSPMDSYNASIKDSSQSGRHSIRRQAEGARGFPGYQPSLSCTERWSDDRRRQEKADSLSGFEKHGYRISGSAGSTIGGARGEGEDFTQFQSVVTWTPEQAHQAQGANSSASTENHHPRSGVGIICAEYAGKDQAPLGALSAMPRGNAGVVQHQTRGDETDETRIESGIPQSVRPTVGGTTNPGDHQCGRTDVSPERHYGHVGNSGGSGRVDGRGRCRRNSRQSRRGSCHGKQRSQDGNQGSFQGSGIATKGGSVAPEDQERQGQSREIGAGALNFERLRQERLANSLGRNDGFGNPPPIWSPQTANQDSGSHCGTFHPSRYTHFAEHWRQDMQNYWCSVQSQASWVRGSDFWNTGHDAKVCIDDDHSNYGKCLHSVVTKDFFHEGMNCQFGAYSVGQGSFEPHLFGEGASQADTDAGKECSGSHICGGEDFDDVASSHTLVWSCPLSWRKDGGRVNTGPSWSFSAEQFEKSAGRGWSWQCCEEDNLDLQERCIDQRNVNGREKLGKELRKVSFANEVALFCHCEDTSAHAVILLDDWQACCRSLWHEHGQIAQFKQFQAVLDVYDQQSHPGDVGSATDNRNSIQRGYCRDRNVYLEHEDESVGTGVLQGLRMLSDNVRPEFADTWFLDQDRFPLCIKPRKLRLENKHWMSEASLVRSCKTLWNDLDNGSEISLFVVTEAPTRLPAIRFHVIIIQGERHHMDWTLLHSVISPTFYRFRAVLFPRGCTVNDFFYRAQVEAPCNRYDRSCFLSHTEHGRTTYWKNDELFHGTNSGFVEGGVRILHLEDSEDDRSDSGIEEGSTDCPSSSDDDLEEASFVQGSTQPMMFQFDDENAYPWMNQGLDDPEDEVLIPDEFDNPMGQVHLAEGHWDHLQEELDHMSGDDCSQESKWTAVTYGLSIFDLGRRDVEFQRDSMASLIQAIMEAWSDHLTFGDITVYTVHPQPTNLIGNGAIALLVVMATPEDLEDGMRNVLVIEEAVDEVGARPEPYGAKIVNEITDREVLFHLDLHHHCPPFALRPFYVRMGMSMMVHAQRYNLDHGTLCKTWIGHTFSQVAEAELYITEAETFFLQVQSLVELRGTGVNIVCRVHGISPGNRPIGHRDIIVPADWIYDLEWIHKMQRLWPFQDENILLHFVVHATADMREEPNVVFHFIANCGIDADVPILVNQQLVSVDACRMIQVAVTSSGPFASLQGRLVSTL